MNPGSGSPFDSIEDAHEFLTLLAQTIFETKLDIEADVQRESNSDFPRRAEALKLTLYTLNKLEFHMNRSRRVLNDLRTLRRLLFEERTLSTLTARPKANGQARAETLLPTVASSLSSRLEGSVAGPERGFAA
jgi:hypothetical protein